MLKREVSIALLQARITVLLTLLCKSLIQLKNYQLNYLLAYSTLRHDEGG